LKITPDFISTAEGSVLIELGNTRVICTATVDDGVPGFLKGSGKGWVTSEYGNAAARDRGAHAARGGARETVGANSGNSTLDRPLVARGDGSGSTGRAHRMDGLRRNSGGWRNAHGVNHRRFVALALAFERLTAAGILKNSPLIDSVAATSVGIVDDRALLDLAYEEDSRAEVDMNVVMTGNGHFVEIQATAEGRAFSGSEMQDLLHSPPRGFAV